MMGRILVPLDSSAVAEVILPHAWRWARASGHSLLLLSVLRPPQVPDPLTGEVDEAGTIPYAAWAGEQQRTRAYLEGWAARLGADGPSAEVMIREGDAATEIVIAAAGEPGVAGVAMTTHGRGGLARLWFGSVAEKVWLSSPRPLLVLRPPVLAVARLPAPAPYRGILVPLDGSDAAEQALPVAQDLARGSGATVTLARVEAAAPEPGTTALTWAVPKVLTHACSAREYLERMATRLRAAGQAVDTQVLTGPPAEALARYSEASGVDIVVMATHPRGGLKRVLYGSVAWHVVQQAARPVLLVRT